MGYSLGGIVAFEMAQQLRTAHEPVALVALLDSRLWSPPVDLSLWQRVRLHCKTLWHSSNQGRWHYLRERARLLAARIRRGNLHGSEEDVVLGLNLSPASRKIAGVHYHAWRSYEPRAYDGRLTLFVAQQNPDFSASLNGVDSTLGWSRWSTKEVEVHHTNSTHAEILRTPELQILAEKTQRTPLAACVNGADGSAGSPAAVGSAGMIAVLHFVDLRKSQKCRRGPTVISLSMIVGRVVPDDNIIQRDRCNGYWLRFYLEGPCSTLPRRQNLRKHLLQAQRLEDRLALHDDARMNTARSHALAGTSAGRYRDL